MALSETGYSRLITWLKVALPLAALGILSTVFMVAQSPEISATIPYADVNVAALAREPQVVRPDFSGVSSNGSAVSILAATARPSPDNANLFFAEDVSGEILLTDGGKVRMRSVSGVVDTVAGLVTMTGDVQVETSTGFALRSEELVTRLDATLSESAGPVDVMAPFGHLTAGSMRISREGEDETSHLLVFSNGVDLIYEPGN